MLHSFLQFKIPIVDSAHAYSARTLIWMWTGSGCPFNHGVQGLRYSLGYAALREQSGLLPWELLVGTSIKKLLQ